MPAWTRGTLLLAAVFLLGGGVGYDIGRSPHGRAAAVNPMEPHTFVKRLTRDLNLDSSQSAAILAVMLRRQAEIDSAWRALRPTVRATIDSTQREIVATLRADQRQRYMKLFQTAHAATTDGSASAHGPF
jgi:hypothetical protein